MSQSNTSPVDPAKHMQSNRAAIDTVEAAVASAKFNDARDNVAILYKNFMALRGYWSSQLRPDVVRIIGDGMNRFSSLEELLGHPEVNVERVRTTTVEFPKEVLSRLP